MPFSEKYVPRFLVESNVFLFLSNGARSTNFTSSYVEMNEITNGVLLPGAPGTPLLHPAAPEARQNRQPAGTSTGAKEKSQHLVPSLRFLNDLAKVVVSHKHLYPTTTPDSNKVTVLFCERS